MAWGRDKKTWRDTDFLGGLQNTLVTNELASKSGFQGDRAGASAAAWALWRCARCRDPGSLGGRSAAECDGQFA